jgi:hypothetical protein
VSCPISDLARYADEPNEHDSDSRHGREKDAGTHPAERTRANECPAPRRRRIQAQKQEFSSFCSLILSPATLWFRVRRTAVRPDVQRVEELLAAFTHVSSEMTLVASTSLIGQSVAEDSYPSRLPPRASRECVRADDGMIRKAIPYDAVTYTFEHVSQALVCFERVLGSARSPHRQSFECSDHLLLH